MSGVDGVSVIDVSESFPAEAEKREYPIDVTDAVGVNVIQAKVRSAPSQLKRTLLSPSAVPNSFVMGESPSGCMRTVSCVKEVVVTSGV